MVNEEIIIHTANRDEYSVIYSDFFANLLLFNIVKRFKSDNIMPTSFNKVVLNILSEINPIFFESKTIKEIAKYYFELIQNYKQYSPVFVRGIMNFLAIIVSKNGVYEIDLLNDKVLTGIITRIAFTFSINFEADMDQPSQFVNKSKVNKDSEDKLHESDNLKDTEKIKDDSKEINIPVDKEIPSDIINTKKNSNNISEEINSEQIRDYLVELTKGIKEEMINDLNNFKINFINEMERSRVLFSVIYRLMNHKKFQ